MSRVYGQNLIGCRWIYNVNYDYDGAIDRYKASVYPQTYGLTRL